jgi:hypothetical protein
VNEKSKRPWVRVAVVCLFGAVALTVALVVRPGDASLAAEAFVLFLGALGAAVLTRATSTAFAAPTESQVAVALRPRRPKVRRVPELERLERELEMSTQSAYDTHYRLRPILREIAAGRLGHSAVELDRPGSRAEELLGPDAWALVRPDSQRPADHHAPGASLAEIERAIDALEAVGPPRAHRPRVGR